MKQRKVAVLDIDGTLIRWQLFHAIADALVRLGHIDKAYFQAVKDARMDWKRRTSDNAFKTYEQQLVVAYESMLVGLSPHQFNEAAQDVFDEYKDQVYVYTRKLIKQLKEDNYLLFAISGSQTEIIAKIAGYYGFDDFVGTSYAQSNGKYTGQRFLPSGQKHIILEQLVAKHNASKHGSIAVGDSMGDLSMLEAVERPIAFNPEKPLFEEAKKRRWQIVLERKNVIIKLEPNDDGLYVLAEADA